MLYQGSHKLWKSWNSCKITKKVSCMEKSWNLKNLNNHGKSMEFCENTCSKKTVWRTLACPTASFLATGGFKFQLFQNACMVYRHAVVAAFHIYVSVVKLGLKGKVEICALNSHGNYIVDHGKSWKNHGIVFLNFCGNSVVPIASSCQPMKSVVI